MHCAVLCLAPRRAAVNLGGAPRRTEACVVECSRVCSPSKQVVTSAQRPTAATAGCVHGVGRHASLRCD